MCWPEGCHGVRQVKLTYCADGASQACPFCRYLVIGEPKRPPINISGKIETILTPRGFPAAKSIQPETA